MKYKNKMLIYNNDINNKPKKQELKKNHRILFSYLLLLVYV